MALQPSFSSSSSSSSFGYGCSYDVFLSFRGTDTRYGFTGYLYKALCDRGINAFIDDEELQQGEEITPSLVKAIQESRIAIAVFSTNYAASSFCLDELAKIIECFKANGRFVLPVFYKVDPSHVRHQRGSYGEAMAKHEERFKDDMEKVKKWREALSQVADLSGYHFTGDGYEHKFIEKIVDAVSRKIKRVFLSNADYPVGLEYRVSNVTSLMDVGTNDGVYMGYAREDVEDILHAHQGHNMKYQIEVLVDKSLIKIGRFGIVTLHDLVEDMGKEIIRQKSPKEPGKRRRLWFHEDIVQVLEDSQGTGEIEIIHLDLPLSEEKREVEWDEEAFKKMENLKTLIIGNGHFLEVPKHLPNSLRVLVWWRYPSQSLPYDFHPKKLCIFKLPGYCCVSLDLASFLFKKFVKLKVLNFDNSVYLKEIPDVSGLTNLEKLSFKRCHNLTSIHDSIGFLNKLKILSAFSCSKLRSFPPIKLPSLEMLNLSECQSLKNFPEILGKM